MSEFDADCLKERGRVLDGLFAHYCFDWDGMTVDETCAEISCCNCNICILDNDCDSTCCLGMEVPEEVKQNARDYYGAMDPFR